MKRIKNIYCCILHAINRHEGIRYVLALLVNGTIIFALYHIIVFLVISLLPASFYFRYYSVEPLKTEYAIGEDIIMVSNTVFFKSSFIEWTDTLRCPDPSWYSQSISQKFVEPKEKNSSQWRYAGEVPNYATSCVIDAQIVATV